MYCPEHILINKGPFMLTMYGSYDVPKRHVPKTWWVNPFRYELIIRSPKYIRINTEGRMRIKVANLIFRIKVALGLIKPN